MFRLIIYLLFAATCHAAAESYSHFEARQTHPVRISADGSQLFALNTPDGRLSVFDISNPEVAAPLLIAEIPVGLEPVSLAQNPQNLDEVWVVNELSDSISVVSLSRKTAIAHIDTGDEPADIAFLEGRAFVTAARDNTLQAFDPTTRQPTGELTLEALFPRAICADPATGTLYIAAQMSGNNTTILPPDKAPAPPVPTNPELPEAPHTGLIVTDDHAEIAFDVLDHDIAVVDAATLTLTRYVGDVGTNLFAPALRPGTSELWVTNTEALNHIRFEPVLRGHFVDNRVTKIDLATSTTTPIDLNPDIDYSLLPNAAAINASIAQPKAIAFEPGGAHLWVAGFGSDNIARIDAATGQVITRISLSNSTEEMRAPRGLALDTAAGRLFVLNRFANSLTTIDTATNAVAAEIPLGSFDPTPTNVRQGRGFLFDARLSGNGTNSCASCHIDADRDGLAWDLGDPGGDMLFIEAENRTNHDAQGNDRPPETVTRALHPMKGPKVTQTMRGLTIDPVTFFDSGVTGEIVTKEPSFHWRGDVQKLNEFNGTYDNLMGGSQITPAQFELLEDYLRTLRLHPNPYRNLDRSAPDEILGGDPAAGRANFLDHGLSHCATCHPLPSGSDQNIDELNQSSTIDFLKTPPLMTSYQKQNTYSPRAETSLSGFGFGHDGTGVSLPLPHFYFLSVMNVEQLIDTRAYVLAFDSISDGTAPAVGHTITVTSENAGDPATAETLDILEQRTDPSLAAVNQHWNDLTAFGKNSTYLFDATTQTYSGIPRADLLSSLAPGDTLQFKSVPPGCGTTLVNGRDPSMPAITVTNTPDGIKLDWGTPRVDWYPESSVTGAKDTWSPLHLPTDNKSITLPQTTKKRLIRTPAHLVITRRYKSARRNDCPNASRTYPSQTTSRYPHLKIARPCTPS